MSIKWLVSFPLGQHGLARLDKESDRDFARRLVQAKQFAEAAAVYEHLLKQEPRDVALLTNLSLVEAKQSHWQPSARYAEQATRLHQKNAKAWYRLGCALAGLGLADKAEACCKQALALDASSAAVLELQRSLADLPTPLSPLHEIYGALINAESPASALPEPLWRRVLSFCREEDLAAVRLACTLLNHAAWKLAPASVTVHAGRKVWRMAHRVPQLQELSVLIRHSRLEEDWKAVYAELFREKPLATVFPTLARLSIQPTVTGLSAKEIKQLVAQQNRDQFDDESHLEEHLAGPPESRLDLAAALGRTPPRLIVHLTNMLVSKTLPSNLYGLSLVGNLHNYTSDHFKVLLRSNLFYLKIVAHALDEAFGHSYGGGDITARICEYFPATLEHLSIKDCSGFEFPTAKLPQGLKYLSVRGLYWQHPNLKVSRAPQEVVSLFDCFLAGIAWLAGHAETRFDNGRRERKGHVQL